MMGFRRILVALGVAAFWLSSPLPALAQSDDPLSLSKSNPGYDSEKSRQVLAEHFAGAWRVTLVDEDGQKLSGRAEVAEDGSGISMVLDGPEGLQSYRSLEVDAARFAAGSGPFLASLTARFRWLGTPAAEGEEDDDSETLLLPYGQDGMTFELDGMELDLPLSWSEPVGAGLRIQISTRDDEGLYEGLWSREVGDSLKGGGQATWIRGAPEIAGVVVIDDQLDPSAGSNYPFRPDGSEIAQVSRERMLVVYGKHLPKFADGAAIESLSGSLAYANDNRSGADRRRVIDAALKEAKVENPDGFDALLVKAVLAPGVTPGSKTLSLDGARGSWDLLFANQEAVLRFVRRSGETTTVFYPGDSGRVELAFTTEMPPREIGVRLLKGSLESPEEVGVLLARRVDRDDPTFQFFQTEAIHFLDWDNAALRPPDDPEALSFKTAEGAEISALLLDPAEAVTLPFVARAQIFADPSQLGPLWEEALDRVAACGEGTIEDYEAFQMQEASRVSRVILTELGSRDIRLLNGDQAAAILIRDEFVRQTLQLVPIFRARAEDEAQMRAYREAAKASPAVAGQPFWQNMKGEFEKQGWLWDPDVEIPMVETLDVEDLAETLNVTPEEAEALALEQTMAAAQRQAQAMEDSVSLALDAGDCEIENMLVIAGHRAPGVVSRILPRLVKKETSEGREYWVADTVAQGFVKGLSTPGAAVRALEEYSEADTDVGLAVAAIVTMGTSAGLQLAGRGTAALYAALTAEAIDLASEAIDIYRYFKAEERYDIATGAAVALGDDILQEAMADRKSALTTALGTLVSGGATAANLKQLRHFRNVESGKQLLRGRGGVLDDLSELSEAERLDLAAYYGDILSKARKKGLGELDPATQADFATFQKYFKEAGATPPSAAPRRTATAPDTAPGTSSVPEPAARPSAAGGPTAAGNAPAGRAPAGSDEWSQWALQNRNDLGRSDDVYRHYAFEPNPQVMNPETREAFRGVLGDMAANRPHGGRAMIQVGNTLKERQAFLAGRDARAFDEAGFVHFQRSKEHRGKTTGRIYIRADANHVDEVMEHVVKRVVDDPARFPQVNSAKVAGPQQAGRRRDNIVIYTGSPEARQRVLDEIAAYQKRNPGHFVDTTPPMTRREMPGVATGDEPIKRYPGEVVSFGSVRADAIHAAVTRLKAFEKAEGLRFPEKTYEGLYKRFLDDELRKRGVDPLDPSRNLPSGG